MNHELRRHWSALLAAGTGVMLGVSAIPALVLGVFAGPMTREFGWSLGDYMAGTVFFTLGILVCSSSVGALCDRHGARAVALAGMPLGAVGVAGLALTQSPAWSWWLLMFLSALLGSGTLPTVWTRMVNALFERQRGLALGLVLSGSGLFLWFGAPLAQRLIEAFGWRGAWLGLALLPLVVGWAVVAVAFRGDDLRAPAGVHPGVPARAAHAAAVPAIAGLTHHEAMRHYRFWVMAFGFGAVTIGVGGMNTSFVPILISKGISARDAAQLIGTMGAAIAVGRLAIGAVIDRAWAPGVAAAVLGLPAISTWLLVGDGVTTGDARIAAALLGFAQGAEYDFLAYLTARYFGMAHYGRIYGRIVIPVVIATAVGAFGVGRSKDLFGSFDTILPVIGLLFAAGALSMLALGRYPRAYAPAHEAAPAAA
jgi:MFS transporter, OFA family, oxalate/formate antiporter